MSTRVLVIDSAPLGLLFQRFKLKVADDCREWVRRHVAAGARIVVPEIVNYELRRELLRLNKTAAVRSLRRFLVAEPDRFIPIDSATMDLAAVLWAQARQRGTPTAHHHALDVDVILAAQVLGLQLPPSDFVVATSNVAHLAQFVPAEEWSRI